MYVVCLARRLADLISLVSEISLPRLMQTCAVGLVWCPTAVGLTRIMRCITPISGQRNLSPFTNQRVRIICRLVRFPPHLSRRGQRPWKRAGGVPGRYELGNQLQLVLGELLQGG